MFAGDGRDRPHHDGRRNGQLNGEPGDAEETARPARCHGADLVREVGGLPAGRVPDSRERHPQRSEQCLVGESRDFALDSTRQELESFFDGCSQEIDEARRQARILEDRLRLLERVSIARIHGRACGSPS